MHKLIGLAGKRGSGKNSAARMIQSILKRRLPEYLHDDVHPDPFQELAFADTIKKQFLIMTGYRGWTQDEKSVWMPEFGMTVGEGLQKFGTGLRDTFHKEVWVLATLKLATGASIITDVRFPNEVFAIHARGGFVLRIEGNPVGIQGDGKRDDTHESETALDDYPFTYRIYNDGTKADLYQKLKQFIDHVLPVNPR